MKKLGLWIALTYLSCIGTLHAALEIVITEGVDPSSLNMRLFLVLHTVAQCTKPGERETEYASDARSEVFI